VTDGQGHVHVHGHERRVESSATGLSEVRPERREAASATAGKAVELATVHLAVGTITLVAFLVSGYYMLTHEPPLSRLEPGLHLMFNSRHIYMLAAAMVHLILGSHMRPASTGGQVLVQWTGSLFLTLGSALLIAAFLAEPVAGRYPTALSRYGLSSLFVGAALHFGVGMRGRVRQLGL